MPRGQTLLSLNHRIAPLLIGVRGGGLANKAEGDYNRAFKHARQFLHAFILRHNSGAVREVNRCWSGAVIFKPPTTGDKHESETTPAFIFRVWEGHKYMIQFNAREEIKNARKKRQRANSCGVSWFCNF